MLRLRKRERGKGCPGSVNCVIQAVPFPKSTTCVAPAVCDDDHNVSNISYLLQ